MTKRRNPPPRASASYPTQFAKLLLHVANTGESITIHTLGNERRFYTSFRARIHEFRRKYYDEALADTKHPQKLANAELMYAVKLRNPKQVKGQWCIEVCPKEDFYAHALDEVLPDEDFGLTSLTEDEEPKEDSSEEQETPIKAIKDVFGA